MGIFQSDMMIKTALELGMEDMRSNDWLIDDMLSQAVSVPFLRQKYGQKQIDACKEWFKNNQIDIYMRTSSDQDKMPCVTITLGTSNEKDEMKTMADLSTCKTQLLPNTIGKPIPYVLKPFTPIGYDKTTGIIEIDQTLKGIDNVAEGMIIVNPSTGIGMSILEITEDGVRIEAGHDLDASTLAVVVQFQFYEARIEHTWMQESYTIGCHVHGDEQALLWLHSVVIYTLFRYRQSLFEAYGFGQANISSSDLMENAQYAGANGEKAFSRFVTLTGMVENSWIKGPHRVIENVALRQENKNGDGYTGGIKILSNIDANDSIDRTKVNWYAVDGIGDSPEDNEEE
jgi:hypothetical protein